MSYNGARRTFTRAKEASVAEFPEEIVERAMARNKCSRDEALAWLRGNHPTAEEVRNYRRLHNIPHLDTTKIKKRLRQYLPFRRYYEAAMFRPDP